MSIGLSINRCTQPYTDTTVHAYTLFLEKMSGLVGVGREEGDKSVNVTK
jgi:hypothetical protein